ncbi:hypothetical protein VC157_07075 [Citrobacter freundii]|nr:hypothetical protein [Citrobacter freundii]
MIQDWLDYQNLETARSAMKAAWESVTWTKISAIASWISIVLSAITLGVAIYAMGTWKSQEKVNAKREIKKAAGKLYVEVGLMPERFINKNVTNGQVFSKSPNFEVFVSQKNQSFIDEWLMHEKLSELYLQLKYLGYAVADDLTSVQKEALKDMDVHFQNYYSYTNNKEGFEKSLKDFLDKMEVYK